MPARLRSHCCNLDYSPFAHSGRRERQLLHSPGHRRRAVSPATAISGGSGLHTDSIRTTGHATGNRRHEHEDRSCPDSGKASAIERRLISNTLILGALLIAFATIGLRHTCLGHRVAGILLWSIHIAAIHEHEYPCLRGHHGKADQCRQFHREHDAADVDQLWRRGRRSDYRVFRSRYTANPTPNDSRHS